MIASPATSPRCLIRIVGTIIHEDALHGYTVDYIGARFTVPASSLIEHVEKHMGLFEFAATIIQPTGRASFLVAHAGQRLRVHMQQIRLIEEVVA